MQEGIWVAWRQAGILCEGFVLMGKEYCESDGGESR